MNPTPSTPSRPAVPRESLWLNLLFNAALPAVILSVASRERLLGPTWGLIAALVFPLGYGVYDLIRRRTWNVLSLLGVVSTMASGGLGLMKMSGLWFAVKEATLPLILGLAVPLSLRTRQPLVRTLLYNDQVLDTARIQSALEARAAVPAFDRLLVSASWMLAASFLVSAIVNFLLAFWLLPSESGTEAFNRQLAKLQFWSWPGTIIPCSAMIFYALFRLLRGVEALTGLTGAELFHPSPTRPAKPDRSPDPSSVTAAPESDLQKKIAVDETNG
ncbi:MAG TPA: VC0807 family protein [Verrucomicrobiota bacterium]|nr:VC0807 family protein [Verrucomicrobiota bacterium]HNU50129.1 VC0807 family protein [Verrucomicrobiota bacterium]